MGDDDIDLDELAELEGLAIDADDIESSDDGEDLDVAYYLGRESDLSGDEKCPYHQQDAIDEWKRGRADADRYDIYSMRKGSPPDRYRDPD